MFNKNTKYLNPQRVYDMMINHICNDDLESFIELYNTNPDTYKRPVTHWRTKTVPTRDTNNIKFLRTAISHCSERCTDYLITKMKVTYDMPRILRDAKWINLVSIFYFCQKMGIANNMTNDSIIERLLEPSKIRDNSKRLDYVLTLIEDGFTDVDTVLKIIDTYDTNKESYKKIIIPIARDLRLTKLGIV